MRSWVWYGRCLGCLVAVFGCGVDSQPKVVVYTALDREFSEPILKRYQAGHGVIVEAKYDIESTKTIALTNQLLAERARPRCDLFWNNEILNTLRLKRQGLLGPFTPANAEDFPEEFRARDGTWYGFAARARVLLVNVQLLALDDRPKSIMELVLPKWRGKVGLAKPLFGTTATHAACLFSVMGYDKAKAFFQDLKANEVRTYSGNRDVARAVGRGEIAVGLTDTDDAIGEAAEGSPVAIVYLDREADQLGTLFIPNTVAILKNAPHREEAERLASYLLSLEVENSLATGPSAQVPLNRRSDVAVQVETPKTVHAMNVDFEHAAQIWDQVADFLTREFSTP